MKPGRGERIYTIFEAALRCNAAGRAALLDRMCGDDPGLRAEVERLLADDERASRDGFLRDPSPPGGGDRGHRPALLGLRGLDIHILCPHCRNPIELVGLTVDDVTCPACGSTFRLERGSTASWGPRGVDRRLGRFELIEAVGVGAFGSVYKARDPQLDRVVAIKVPRAGSLASGEERDRFQREARSAAQLRHPGIVPVHEVGEHEGLPYLVSDFVTGVTLSDLLTARRPPPREAAGLVAEVADALQFAHERGVVHRDIKPSNVMLDDEGRPHLMDFGLARRDAGEVTMTLDGQVMGTPAYMSPEQARGEAHRVDGRSDTYSLGVVLYELLTGELPFRGNARMLLHQVLHDEPRPPRSLNDRIPRDLETVCVKAMAKEPNRRYAMARDLAEDLRRFRDGEPIRARPVGRLEKAWRWCRRNPSLAVARSAAIAALVAVAVLSIRYGVEQSRARERVAGLLDVQKGLTSNLERRGGELKTALDRSNRLAGDLKKQSDELAQSLKESKRRLAALNFERGHALCEKGEIGPGLLWLAESWRSALEADDPDWRRTARAGLSAWQRHHAGIRAVFSYAGPVQVGSCAALSPDGTKVLTGGFLGAARVWDAATGRPLGGPLIHPGAVQAAAFSPDGTRVLTAGSDGTVRAWDAATGRPIGKTPTSRGMVQAAWFSPDARRLLTAGFDGTVRAWDAATGRPLGGPLTHRGGVHAVAFRPDGKAVLTVGRDGMARVWDAATGRPLGPPLEHRGGVRAAAFSPDGTRVLIGGAIEGRVPTGGDLDEPVWLWDTATGRPLGELLKHRGLVTSMAFSRDGKALLTGGGMDGTVKLWDAATGRPLGELPKDRGLIHSAAFSPDGKAVLTGGFGGARLRNATTDRALSLPLTHRGGVHAVAFRPDGKAVLTVGLDGMARVWDAATGRPLGPPLEHRGGVETAAFGPDGTRVLTAGPDGTARAWDAATGRPLGELLKHQGPIRAVAFSPDGTLVLTGGGDGTARLWDTATGLRLGPSLDHRGSIQAVAFSPDGTKVLTGGFGGTARVWDAATGRPLGPPLEHRGGVQAAAFSPDGTLVLTGGGDGTARLWDIAELPDSPGRLSTWVEVITGLRIDETGSVGELDPASWRERREKLEALGGRPSMAPRWSLDPILSGPEPTARAGAWMRRGCWPEAEAAFDEAVAARPLDTAILLERARFLADHPRGREADDDFARAYLLGNRKPALLDTISSNESLFRRVIAESAGSAAPLWAARGESLAKRRLWAEAAVAFGEAVRLRPDDLISRYAQMLLLQAVGDRAGLGRARTEMLVRSRMTTAPMVAKHVAWASAMAAVEGPDLGETVRLAGRAAQAEPGDLMGISGLPALLSGAGEASGAAFGLVSGTLGDERITLGAVHYRAGRFAEAVHHLDDGVRMITGKWGEAGRMFLAMAHHRLGHRDEARRWLERPGDRLPGPDDFWGGLQVRLLRDEAEAVILWDPIFPADPFAP